MTKGNDSPAWGACYGSDITALSAEVCAADSAPLQKALMEVYRRPSKPPSITKQEKASASTMAAQIIAVDKLNEAFDREPTPGIQDMAAHSESEEFKTGNIQAELNNYSASEVRSLLSLVNADLKKKHSMMRAAVTPNGQIAVGKICKDSVHLDFVLKAKS